MWCWGDMPTWDHLRLYVSSQQGLCYQCVCLGCQCVCHCVTVSVSVSVCLSVCLSVCQCVSQCIRVSVCQYMSVYQCVSMSVFTCSQCQCVCVSRCRVCQCVCLCVSVSVHVSVCLSVCQCISQCVSQCVSVSFCQLGRYRPSWELFLLPSLQRVICHGLLQVHLSVFPHRVTGRTWPTGFSSFIWRQSVS